MILFGSIIVMLTLIAIAKRYEMRMVLCVSGFVMAMLVIMIVQAKLRKEGAGTTLVEKGKDTEQAAFKVGFIEAAVPVVPLGILVLVTPQVGVLAKITIPQAMIIGAILEFAVHRTS